MPVIRIALSNHGFHETTLSAPDKTQWLNRMFQIFILILFTAHCSPLQTLCQGLNSINLSWYMVLSILPSLLGVCMTHTIALPSWACCTEWNSYLIRHNRDEDGVTLACTSHLLTELTDVFELHNIKYSSQAMP